MGTILAALGALAFAAIGLAALFSPRRAAAGYGLRAESGETRAFVRATGARDIVLGVLAGTFLALGDRSALAATLAVSSLAAGADFTIVRAGTRAFTPSLLLHAGGAAALLLAAALVAAGR